ncbi:MAG: S9 family peptidase [Tannerellaceae bacterium]|nr:S9 family peptidase [Tannerellaceae bacterium]
MKQIGLNIFLLFFITGGLFAQHGNKRVDLKEITDGKFRQITSIGEVRPLPDGEHYTAINKEKNMIVKYSYRTGNAVDTLFNTQRARECSFDTFDGYMISETGHRILVWKDIESIYRHSYKATVYDYDVRRNYIKLLPETEGKIMIPTFSPDGRMCAYVKDNNIFLKKFDYDTEVQVTTDGELNKILNGITDWVYEEEFGVTNLMAWSPDSEFLAYVKSDETDVPEFSMQVYGDGLYPGYYHFKYPKAGQKNSTVSLHSYQVSSKITKELAIPATEEIYIPRITFTHDSEQLAVMTLNRHQNSMSMYYINPKSTVPRLVLREDNKQYIDSDWLKSIHFTPNGFTYVSEQDGFAHIYFYSTTGVLQKQLTKGNWDVTRFYGIDEKTQTVYYEAAEESPLRRAVYRVDMKGNKSRLTPAEGTNSAMFSKNFNYFINTHSNVHTPAVITVHETKSGKVLRTLQDNQALKSKLAEYSFSPKEFFTLRTASGVELNAWIIKPADFDPNRKYPVLMVQYSGPNSQQVVDRYGFDWEHYLAANDILVVSVDGCGTGARGEEFRKCTYLRMGELESQDQVEAAQALGRFPYVDPANIAIWGWGFGGYNTLMALSTGNGTFKAGIAVAPPTDWKYYDTIYTERYMRTPNENFEGYAITSPIKLAGQLQGKLLLVHGTADDNVHFHQTMEYAEALVQAGKQFEMQIYKDRDHGIYGGNTRNHLYTRMSNFLFENLK